MPRGGARKGAGRPPKEEGTRRVTLSVTVRPNTRERLERLAAIDPDDSLSLGEVIDNLTEDAAP